ncbi:serine/threonine-protein kinase Nek11-like [Sardina pilchardus]|uniref:serine/threonine-protein kinase Nek11-like n=1 Tax=Sardina pilchardus TaxID=27697 RepID=UPI002E0FA61D
MHQRRILHRDLKAKNIFLKKNIVKIGDFGVSCLLMGSCDLATTFTGTPYYMSPEALSHQGYDAKSDIWSLGCVLYEMCCLAHAFEGHNFLSVVMKIVEGETPCLPERYSTELNTLLQRMLVKDPVSRTSAAEALRSTYIEENMQAIKHKFSSMTLQDRTSGGDQDAAQILKAMQRKVHLQTLQQRAEVQKMTPRERMRLRKLQAADEKARKLKQLAEEKYQENCLRMRELRCRHFQTVTVDVLTDTTRESDISLHQPAPPLDSQSAGPAGSVGDEIAAQQCRPDQMESGGNQTARLIGEDKVMCVENSAEIPEDPLTAEAYYYEDGFESCSEEGEDEMEEDEEDMKDEDESNVESEAYDAFSHTYGQDGDLEAMVWHMENVLDSEPTGAGAEESPRGPAHINTTMARSRIQRMREAVTQKLGEDVFQRVYNYLREARRRRQSELDVREALSRMVERPSDCFEVDQLLYYEEQLQEAQGGS